MAEMSDRASRHVERIIINMFLICFAFSLDTVLASFLSSGGSWLECHPVDQLWSMAICVEACQTHCLSHLVLGAHFKSTSSPLQVHFKSTSSPLQVHFVKLRFSYKGHQGLALCEAFEAAFAAFTWSESHQDGTAFANAHLVSSQHSSECLIGVWDRVG